MDDKGQAIGIGWVVIMFVIVLAFGYFMWILLSPMMNNVFGFVDHNYVETGKISQANYDSGNVVHEAWNAFPIILVIVVFLGYLLRTIYSRGY